MTLNNFMLILNFNRRDLNSCKFLTLMPIYNFIYKPYFDVGY